MDINHLRTFVTIAREGTITRASEILCRSQPAISANIKSLESSLGITLFQRRPDGMGVTRDGQRLLAKAQRLLNEHRLFDEEARRLKGPTAERFHVGFGCGFGAPILKRLLSDLVGRYAELDIRLEHGTSAFVLDGLRGGALDAGVYIDNGEMELNLTVTKIASFEVFVASSPRHISGGGTVDWKSLEALPWICPSNTSFFEKTAQRLFADCGFRPKRIVCADNEGVARHLIAEGSGIGFLYGPALEGEDVVALKRADQSARILFAHLNGRDQEPLIVATRSTFCHVDAVSPRDPEKPEASGAHEILRIPSSFGIT